MSHLQSPKPIYPLSLIHGMYRTFLGLFFQPQVKGALFLAFVHSWQRWELFGFSSAKAKKAKESEKVPTWRHFLFRGFLLPVCFCCYIRQPSNDYVTAINQNHWYQCYQWIDQIQHVQHRNEFIAHSFLKKTEKCIPIADDGYTDKYWSQG